MNMTVPVTFSALDRVFLLISFSKTHFEILHSLGFVEYFV